MKNNFLKSLSILFFVIGFNCQAQIISRSTTEYKIDSLLPINTTRQITPLRLQTAFRRILDYVQPSNFPNQSIAISKLAPSGASLNQVIKWNGAAWVPSDDAFGTGGGSSSWGGITGTLSNQTDLNIALGAKANATHVHNPSDISQAGASTGQVLKWNGSAWAAAIDATGGSPTWGTISGTLSNQADIQNALNAKEPTISTGGFSLSKLAQSGASSGQVLKWNGSAWSPGADNSGSGTPAWGTITGAIADQPDLQAALNNKVTVVSGKGLSTNDYTNTEKDNLLKAFSNRRKSILDYGAIPNDGLSDHLAIQSAINANSEVYIPEGVFLVGASLNIPSNRKIYGDGAGSVLKANNDGVWVFKVYSTFGAISNVIISDLKIDGGGQTANVYTGFKAAYGVYISNATNVVVERLTIDKCGIVNSSSPINDNGWGGYGIVAESRHGVIRNIKIRACHITNIAGGGMVSGDGIYIAGYNASLSVVADNVVVSDCYVEDVGRHCYTVAGEGGESPGYNTTFLNCKGKNAALSGIDFEEGNHCRIEGGEFEGCGNYTGYYNPISLYGPLYRLCVGVATGNETNFVTVKNIRIKDCYYGITAGAGTNNRWEGLVISNSTIVDFQRGLARFGEDNTIKDCKFLTQNKPMNPFFNMPVRCGLLVESCIFVSDLNVAGQWYSAFKDCVFKGKVSFTGAEGELKNILFQNCTFTGTRGLSFENINTYCDDFVVDNCKFQGSGANYYYGVYVVFQSVRRLKITNCTFNNYLGDGATDGYAIRHMNAEAQPAFASISDNSIINCDHGIVIYQGGRYAKINNNRFTSIPNWCIWIQELTSAMALKACSFVGNIADNTCSNGLRIDSPTGSWDYVTILNNQFEDVTATKYSMNTVINNLNGDMALPTAFRVPITKNANFTLNLTDANRTIRVNSSSDVTCTIPTDALVNFPIGTRIKFEQIGTGKIIFSSSIQLNSEGAKLKTNGVRAVCEIEKVDYDQWTLNGSLIL